MRKISEIYVECENNHLLILDGVSIAKAVDIALNWKCPEWNRDCCMKAKRLIFKLIEEDEDGNEIATKYINTDKYYNEIQNCSFLSIVAIAMSSLALIIAMLIYLVIL